MTRVMEPEEGTPEPRTRGAPIGLVLMVANGLLVVVAVVVILIAGYGVARRNTTELLVDKATLVLDVVEEGIADHLNPVRAQVDYLADVLARSDDTGGPAGFLVRDLEPLLIGSLAAAPQVSAVGVVSPERQVVRAFRDRPDEPIQYSDWSDVAEFADSPCGGAGGGPAQQGQDAVRAFFFAERVGRSYLNIGRAVRVADAREGCVIAGTSIRQLSERLARLGTNYEGTVFVLDPEGSVVAHPKLVGPPPGLSDVRPLPTAAQLGDPVLQQIAEGGGRPFPPADRSGVVDIHFVEDADGGHVVLHRSLGGYAERPWRIGLYFPADTAAPQLDRLTQIGYVGLSVLALSLFVTWRMSVRISRPVTRIAAAAWKLRHLDLDAVPPLLSGPFRELNEAARAFRAMVHGLDAFGRFMPRGLVRRLMQESEGGQIASEVRPVTVLFTDIAGFTAFAEDRPAAEVAEFLNEHFSLVDRCVDGEGGTVDKYVGDAVMAFWGAPERHRDHAMRAARAAIAIARAVEDDNRRRVAMGQPPVRLRIGVQSGEVLVGVIGSSRRLNYTIIGDAVNTAERLESLARDLGLDDGPVQIVVGEDTAQQLDGGFALRPLGRHALAGRRDQVEAFVLDWRQSEETEPGAVDAGTVSQSRLRPSKVSSDIE